MKKLLIIILGTLLSTSSHAGTVGQYASCGVTGVATLLGAATAVQSVVAGQKKKLATVLIKKTINKARLEKLTTIHKQLGKSSDSGLIVAASFGAIGIMFGCNLTQAQAKELNGAPEKALANAEFRDAAEIYGTDKVSAFVAEIANGNDREGAIQKLIAAPTTDSSPDSNTNIAE